MKTNEQIVKLLEELQVENAELCERLEKSVELPVKIGDKKYCIDCTKTVVLEETVVGVKLSIDRIWGVGVDYVNTVTQDGVEEGFTCYRWQSFYDTREAAEARLKEIKEEI